MIEIYRDGKFQSSVKKRHLFRHFQRKDEYPSFRILNRPVISFDEERYLKNGEWVYNVSLEIEKYAVDLEFVGTTKGWKIETKTESWTVALPKAKVTGNISVNGKKTAVEGIGYHDHNWNYTILTAMNYGRAWYWGKIRSKSFNIVWANIVQTSKKSKILAILNKENNGYSNIHPENIKFKPTDFKKFGRKKIPTRFKLDIDENKQGTPIVVNVDMKSKEIQKDTVLIAPYFRYHINSVGSITVGNDKEEIDDIQIMEFLKFG